MAPSTTAKLILLSDQAQIGIEERNRLKQLNLSPSSSDDAEIEKSLKTLLHGITQMQLEQYKLQNEQQNSDAAKNGQTAVDRMAATYDSLLQLYRKDPEVSIDHLTYHAPKNDEESILENSRMNKSVRFKDKLEEHEPQQGAAAANTKSTRSARQLGGQARTKADIENDRRREELFVKPYRDDPEEEQNGVDDLSNDQLHLHQQQVMRDQDSHLDRLATSVSRQHELSIQIDDELGQHIELLDEVDRLVDNSQSNLSSAKQRLDKFSRKAKEHGSMLTIGILILIFIILIVVLK